MIFRSAILTCMTLATSAHAQGFAGIRNDSQAIGAFDQMIAAFSGACQAGDAQACGNAAYIRNGADFMLGASDACEAGTPDACDAYANGYRQLNQDYAMFSQSPYAQMAQAPATTHQERMDDIARAGAQSTATFDDRMRQMDVDQQRFLETLR